MMQSTARLNATMIYAEFGNLRDHGYFVLNKTLEGDIHQYSWKTYLSLRASQQRLAFKEPFPTSTVPAASPFTSPVTSVREKSTDVKALPVKSVLVKSVNPYMRAHQHYKPGENPNVPSMKRSHAVDSVIDGLRNGTFTNDRFKKLNADLNKFSSSDKQQMQSLFDSITDRAIKSHVADRSGISSVLKGLDLDHMIAGTSVAGYLMRSLGTYKTQGTPELSHLVDYVNINNNVDVRKDSSVEDKDMAMSRLQQRLSFVDIDKKEKTVDDELSKFVDQHYTENIIHSELYTPLVVGKRNSKGEAPSEKDLFDSARNKISIKHLGTILDHVLGRYGADRVSKVYNLVKSQYPANFQKSATMLLNGEGAANTSQSMSCHLLGASRNPKLLNDFMGATGTCPVYFKGSPQQMASTLIDGWVRGTGHSLGILIRKSVASVTNTDTKHLSTFMIPNRHSLYPTKELAEEHIPEVVVKGIRALHTAAQGFLNSKENRHDPLYRGVDFHQAGNSNVTVHSVVSSMSSDPTIAGKFAVGLGNSYQFEKFRSYDPEIKGESMYRDLEKNEHLLIPDHMKLYISHVDSFGRRADSPSEDIEDNGKRRYLFKYDVDKLQKDKKILAVLTPTSFSYMEKVHHIPVPPITKEYGEEYEYIVAL